MLNRITLDRLVRYVVIIVVIAMVLWALFVLKDLVIFLIIGILLAALMNPIIGFLQRKGFSRTISSIVSLLLVIAIFSGLLASLVPFLAQQAEDLSDLITVNRLETATMAIENFLRGYLPLPDGSFTEGMSRTFEALFQSDSITSIASFTFSIFTNILFAALVIPFFAFFFAKDGRQIRQSIFRLVPNRYFEIFLDLWSKIQVNLGRYFWMLLLRTIVVAIVTSLFLYMAGLDYAVTVGLFTGVVNVIPYFGPVIGIIAALVVAIIQTGNFELVLGVLLAVGIIQGIDAIILQPYLYSKAAKMHPVVILCAVIVGAEFGGILGMLLAIPVLTIAKVTISQIHWCIRNYHVFRVGAA